MHWRIDVKGWRAYFSVSHSVKMKGVNSLLAEGGNSHILLWDFDNKPYIDVVDALRTVQERFQLAPIYILHTGLPNYYHAYCFHTHDWAETLYILASTKNIDKAYLIIGIMRGYWTLRYSPKKGRKFSFGLKLPSDVPEDVNPYMLQGLSYWTKRI